VDAGARTGNLARRLSTASLGGMALYVFELTWPGTRLEGLPDQVAFDVEKMLYLLESALADAAVSLGLFEAEQAAAVARHAQHREGWEQKRAAEAALVAQFESQLAPDLPPEERWRLDEQTRERARIEAERARWRGGQLPDAYAHRLPFLHAKSCLYALDTIAKAIRTLGTMPGLPAGVAQAQADFEARFPTLVAIRDTAHHPEDRIRGVRGGRSRETPIVAQPILSNAMHAPGGGVIVLDFLDDNRYGGTLADGTYGQVEISAGTVTGAQQLIQQVLDAFSWRGPRQHKPM
jgi:hypothetical protein